MHTRVLALLAGVVSSALLGCGGNHRPDPLAPPEPQPAPPPQRAKASVRDTPPPAAPPPPVRSTQRPAASEPRAVDPSPPDRPAAVAPLPEPTPVPQNEPKPTPAPADKPAPQSDDAGDERDRLPPYLRVLRTRPTSQVALPDARTEGTRVLRITSNDATRMRITRRDLPLRTSESIVLRIDSQVFEWTRARSTIEVVLTPSGGWQVVDP